jgi:hypothetical protein
MRPPNPLGSYQELGSLHTFVEFASNTMVMGEMEFLHHVKDIIQGTLPVRLLCDASHEMTHHWCFNSPVGTALALLKLRAGAATFTGTKQADIFYPLIKLECALEMMRPIAEGLALFSEFDMLPGRGDVRAPIAGWLLYLFAREGMEKGEYWDRALNLLLRHARSNEAAFKRRENLFVQPLAADAGGYLPGYLLVKTLWNKFKLSSSQLKDAELFLCFFRSFFYDDLELASRLLTVDAEPVDAALDLLEYIQGRIEMIVNLDLTVNIDRFHEHTRKLTHQKPIAGSGLSAHNLTIVPGIGNDHVVLADVIEFFEHASSEVYDYPEEIPTVVGQVSMWIFQQRDLLWLGGASGQVLVNEFHRAVFSIEGKQIAGAPVLEDINQQEEDGSIEAFFSTTYLQLFFVISIKAKPVAVVFMGNVPEIFANDVKRSVADRGLYLRILAEQEEVIAEFHKKQPSYELLEEMRRFCNEKRNAVFAEVALHSVDPDKRESCKSAMVRRGFWNVLGSNLESVKRFTVLSEVVAYGAAQSDLDMVKEKAGWSLFALETCLRAAGFPETQIDTHEFTVFI